MAAGRVRLEADAAAIADRDEVEGGADRRVDQHVAAHLGAHGAVVQAHQRRAGEHVRPAEQLAAVHQPPAEIVEAPHWIAAPPIAADHQPLTAMLSPSMAGHNEAQHGRPPQSGFHAHALHHHGDGHQRAIGKRGGEQAIDGNHGNGLETDAQPPLPRRHGGEHLLGFGGGIIGLGRLGRRADRDAEIAQTRGQRPHRVILIDVAHGNPACAEPAPELGHHLGSQQGVSAEIQEEVVLDRHRRGAEALLQTATTACSRSPTGAT